MKLESGNNIVNVVVPGTLTSIYDLKTKQTNKKIPLEIVIERCA